MQTVQRALEQLTDPSGPGVIVAKEIGKQKIFYANQDKLATADDAELKRFDERTKKADEQQKEMEKQLKALEMHAF